MTDSSKSKSNWVLRYRAKFVSAVRFSCWNRRQQQSYLDMRRDQLKEINEWFQTKSDPPKSQIDKMSNARRYRKIERELKVKEAAFNKMDDLAYDQRVWCMIGHKHPSQRTLEEWIPGLLQRNPKDI